MNELIETPLMCVICQLEIVDVATAHMLHESSCLPENRSMIAGCDCDIYAHAECCPVCKSETK